MNLTDRTEYQEKIRKLIREKERAIFEINQLVKEAEPDYHFLDHWVSHFWTCDKSPFGWCLFKREMVNMQLILGDCIYCGQPVERK